MMMFDGNPSSYYVEGVAGSYHIFMIKNGINIMLTRPNKPLSEGQVAQFFERAASGKSTEIGDK